MSVTSTATYKQRKPHYATNFRIFLSTFFLPVLSRAAVFPEGRHSATSFSPCPRCTRNHPPSACRSLDRMCRQCGLVGHFVEIHSVTDPKFRRDIVAELGFDVFSAQGCEMEPIVGFGSAAGQQWSTSATSKRPEEAELDLFIVLTCSVFAEQCILLFLRKECISWFPKWPKTALLVLMASLQTPFFPWIYSNKCNGLYIGNFLHHCWWVLSSL